MKKSILLIGKVPPPVGGVSIFVSRLYSKLLKESYNVTLFPRDIIINFSVVIKLAKHSYSRIILNSMSLPLLLLLFFSFNLRKTELVDHNHSRRFDSTFKTKLLLFFIAKMSKVHLVDEHLESNYQSLLLNFCYMNPFIQPTDSEIKTAEKLVPEHVKYILNNCDQVFVISAWRFILENKQDLYGIERTCNIFQKLLKIYPNVGLIVCIGDSSVNSLLLGKIKSAVERYENIIFWENCTTSWILFSENAVYLRPTSTDGNSISIHEALHFNSSVIASDVVPRPNECTLFKFESDEDYIEKIRHKIGEKNETSTAKSF